MESFRLPHTQKLYEEYKMKTRDVTCFLCEKPAIMTFNHWKIVENSFPYDRFASVHHILIPLRHCKEEELTKKELQEFMHIKETVINRDYEFIQWSTTKYQSVPSHHHVHLIVSIYRHF